MPIPRHEQVLVCQISIQISVMRAVHSGLVMAGRERCSLRSLVSVGENGVHGAFVYSTALLRSPATAMEMGSVLQLVTPQHCLHFGDSNTVSPRMAADPHPHDSAS